MDRPDFYDYIFQIIDYIEKDSYICCGDLNLVLNTLIITIINQWIIIKEARNLLLRTNNSRHILDPFRERNEDIRQHTWRGTSLTQQARLDLRSFYLR